MQRNDLMRKDVQTNLNETQVDSFKIGKAEARKLK